MNRINFKLALGQIGSAIFSALGVIFAARACGPSDFAYVSICLAILSILVDVVDFGGCSWSSRELAKGTLTLQEYIEILKVRFSLLVCLSPIWALGAVLFTQKPLATILFFVYTVFWLGTSYFQAVVTFYEIYDLGVAGVLIERGCWLLVLPMTLIGLDSSISYIVSILIGLGCHCGIFFKFLKLRDVVIVSNAEILQRIREYRKHMQFGSISIISDLSNLDSSAVAYFSKLEQAGSYSFANKFRNQLLLSVNIVGARLKPLLSRGDIQSAKKLLKESRLFFVGNTLTIFLISATGFFTIQSLLGDKFKDTNLVFSISILSIPFLGISTLMSIIMTSCGLEKVVVRITLMSTLLTLVAVSFGAIQNGALGAVSGYFLSTTLISMVYIMSLRKHMALHT